MKATTIIALTYLCMSCVLQPSQIQYENGSLVNIALTQDKPDGHYILDLTIEDLSDLDAEEYLAYIVYVVEDNAVTDVHYLDDDGKRTYSYYYDQSVLSGYVEYYDNESISLIADQPNAPKEFLFKFSEEGLFLNKASISESDRRTEVYIEILSEYGRTQRTIKKSFDKKHKLTYLKETINGIVKKENEVKSPNDSTILLKDVLIDYGLHHEKKAVAFYHEKIWIDDQELHYFKPGQDYKFVHSDGISFPAIWHYRRIDDPIQEPIVLNNNNENTLTIIDYTKNGFISSYTLFKNGFLHKKIDYTNFPEPDSRNFSIPLRMTVMEDSTKRIFEYEFGQLTNIITERNGISDTTLYEHPHVNINYPLDILKVLR